MTDIVWICTAPSEVTISDIIQKTDINADGDKRIIELGRIERTGGAIPPENLPTSAWGRLNPYRSHHFPSRWPDLISYSNLWFLSNAAACVLGRFDLGAGHIAPLRLFEADRTTPVPGAWSVWNIGNQKSALLPEQSQGLRPAAGRAFALLEAKDRDIQCSHAALGGSDMWIDLKLRRALFLSGPLGEALQSAGLATEAAGFGTLLRCDVVQQ